jgi:TRAP-type transport system periplasmic protein
MKNGFAIRALATALTLAGPALAQAAEPVTLKFGFPAPVVSYVNTQGMTPWIDRVEKASGGTLNIKLFAGPTLGTFRDIYDRTLAGVSQISFGVFGPYAAQFPRTQVSSLPFLSDDAKVSSAALWRLYAKGVIAPEYGKVKVLALFNFPNSTLHTNKPIDTLADLKGLKIAVSSRVLGEVAAALGTSPVTLTPSEIYQGLSRGVANGAFIAWTAVRTFKLDEVTKDHLNVPLGQAPAFVFMNKAAYDGLPAQAKKAIDENSGEAFSAQLGANNEAADRAEGEKVAAEPGARAGKLAPAQTKAWEARIDPVIEAWAKHTPDGAKVLAAYRAELKQLSAMK